MIIKNDSTPHNAFWWHRNKNTWAVRKDDWKLLKNPTDPSNKAPITANDSLFLVNIHDHPDEMTNLANEYPEKVKELILEYDAWYMRCKQ